MSGPPTQEKTLVVGIYIGLEYSEIVEYEGQKLKRLSGNFSEHYGVLKLIGRSFDDPLVQSISNNYPYKLISDVNNTFKISVEHNGNTVEKFPDEIITELLKDLKQEALKEYQDIENIAAVITVPVYFDEFHKNSIMKSAQMAEIVVLQLIEEPLAHAIGYFHNRPVADTDLLVFEYGIGFSDISIIRRKGNNIKMICHDGDNSLGYDQLFKFLLDYFVAEFKKINMSLGDEQIELLSKYIKDIPSSLEESSEVKVTIPSIEIAMDGMIMLTKSKYNEFTEKLIKRWISNIDRFLHINLIQKSEIKEVHIFTNEWETLKLDNYIKKYMGDVDLLSYYGFIHHVSNSCSRTAAGAAILAFQLISDIAVQSQ